MSELEHEWDTLYVYRNGKFVPSELKIPGRKPRYPLHKLEIGQSFFIPGKAGNLKYLYERAQRLDIVIKQRTTEEHGVVGVRVWRVG